VRNEKLDIRPNKLCYQVTILRRSLNPEIRGGGLCQPAERA